MENAAAMRCCDRPRTIVTRKQSGTASSTRTAASRLHSERSRSRRAHAPPAAPFNDGRNGNYPKGIPMDTVTAISERRLEAVPEPVRAPAATKMLTVTATYLLSEEGRKA